MDRDRFDPIGNVSPSHIGTKADVDVIIKSYSH